MGWHYQPACDSPWIVWKRKGIGAEDRPVCHGLQQELQTFLLASDCRVNSGEDPPSVRIYIWDRTLGQAVATDRVLRYPVRDAGAAASRRPTRPLPANAFRAKNC